jgi:hypothetical protein
MLAGVALVLIVWGAATAWGPSGADWLARNAGSTSADASSNGPDTDGAEGDAADGSAFLLRDQVAPSPTPTPAVRSAPPPPPSALAAPSPSAPPVPVRATVPYEIASRGAVTADLEDFATQVARYLSDPKGWPAAGVEFKRVSSGGLITIWLTEDSQVPSFSRICSTGLSCSIDRNIIINEVRWLESAPPGVMDEIPLDQYRMMVVNHEVGHWLGHHLHSSCPGPGEVAPLMMQQSKGLDGCTFNPYPLASELTAPDLFR